MQGSVKAAGKERFSNLELYRVLIMLFIVAHHYVVNSGLTALCNKHPASLAAMMLRLAGAWGKTGINCFVLITGYFMCTGSISLRKFAKLVLPFLLYKVILYPIFWMAGYGEPTGELILKMLLPVRSIGDNFIGCYFVFYLCIPFLNILIRGMNRQKHLALLGLLLTIYTGFSSFEFFSVTMNYLSWFCVVYLMGSFIRLYPPKCFVNCKLWGWATVASIILGCFTILWRMKTGNASKPYFWVSDVQMPLAVSTALCSFLFFKNLKVPQRKWINALGKATFGVLLIHGNNAMMIQWLWKDLLKNTAWFYSPWLALHLILSVLGVFTVCALIDLVRIRFLETPFFRLWDRKYPAFLLKGQAVLSKIRKSDQIKE